MQEFRCTADGDNQLVFLITYGSNSTIIHPIASPLTPDIIIGA
jgi:hypothetical protein